MLRRQQGRSRPVVTCAKCSKRLNTKQQHRYLVVFFVDNERERERKLAPDMELWQLLDGEHTVWYSVDTWGSMETIEILQQCLDSGTYQESAWEGVGSLCVMHIGNMCSNESFVSGAQELSSAWWQYGPTPQRWCACQVLQSHQLSCLRL